MLTQLKLSPAQVEKYAIAAAQRFAQENSWGDTVHQVLGLDAHPGNVSRARLAVIGLWFRGILTEEETQYHLRQG